MDDKQNGRSHSETDVTDLSYLTFNLRKLYETKSTGQWRFTHLNERNGQIKGVGWLMDNTQLYNFSIYHVKNCTTVELISRRKVKFFCHHANVTALLDKIFYKKKKLT